MDGYLFFSAHGCRSSTLSPRPPCFCPSTKVFTFFFIIESVRESIFDKVSMLRWSQRMRTLKNLMVIASAKNELKHVHFIENV